MNENINRDMDIFVISLLETEFTSGVYHNVPTTRHKHDYRVEKKEKLNVAPFSSLSMMKNLELIPISDPRVKYGNMARALNGSISQFAWALDIYAVLVYMTEAVVDETAKSWEFLYIRICCQAYNPVSLIGILILQAIKLSRDLPSSVKEQQSMSMQIYRLQCKLNWLEGV